MTRRHVFVAVVAVVAASGASLATAAPAALTRSAIAGQPAARDATDDGSVPPGATDMLFQAINAERGRLGLSQFRWHDQVGAAALAHAKELAARQQLEHTGSDGSNAGQRLRRAGFVTSYWAENLGSGYRDADRLVAGWMASPAHRANLVGNFRHAGIGVAVSTSGTPFWVLVLAS